MTTMAMSRATSTMGHRNDKQRLPSEGHGHTNLGGIAFSVSGSEEGLPDTSARFIVLFTSIFSFMGATDQENFSST